MPGGPQLAPSPWPSSCSVAKGLVGGQAAKCHGHARAATCHLPCPDAAIAAGQYREPLQPCTAAAHPQALGLQRCGHLPQAGMCRLDLSVQQHTAAAGEQPCKRCSAAVQSMLRVEPKPPQVARRALPHGKQHEHTATALQAARSAGRTPGQPLITCCLFGTGCHQRKPCPSGCLRPPAAVVGRTYSGAYSSIK